MGIPLYGQNKQGNILDIFADAKVIRFSIAVSTSGNANNADTGEDIPADYVPVFSTVTNAGETALAGNTCAFDVGGVDVTADVNALAAGASLAHVPAAISSATSATNILIDGSSGLVLDQAQQQ